MSRYTMLEESKMNEIGLKACPFCGGEARFIKTWITEYVQCKKCKASTGIRSSFEESAEAWNRRNGG